MIDLVARRRRADPVTMATLFMPFVMMVLLFVATKGLLRVYVQGVLA